ncbi:uncharacterized protein LOC107431874 [Ziziphus jujuba]|uniref:Uncharacterized protein LOC107431874 n=1 Tax=Ziziphus jujuba TaxID=326968 RepID=A0A6P4ASG6_ZIZJJ|nr:uncharacterized protein LOC107431874 [Ziziphus jujuba]
MADYAAPSFSLGLDLGFDSEPQIPVEEEECSSPKPAPVPAPVLDPNANAHRQDGKEFETEVAEDSDPETGPQEKRPRILKRLRRGPSQLRETPPSSFNLDDDEIEEFSSQEDSLEELHPSSTQYRTMCSSSKVPLHGSKVSTTQSSIQWKERKKKTISEVPASTNLETRHCEKMFPRLTVSPLRRFQLIDSDSDSDDPSVSEDVDRVPQKIDLSSKKQQFNPAPFAIASEKTQKSSDGMPQNVDLWKDFSPVNRFHIPTPALDEVCEEYFHSMKHNNVAEKPGSDIRSHKTTNGLNIEKSSNLADPLPPAHYYFFHKDTRIRKLIRGRLPNFFPLGIVDSGGNQQHGASFIDYMGQFNNGEPSKRRPTQQTDLQRNSKRGRTKSNKSVSEEAFQASGSCMDAEKYETVQNTSAKKSSTRGKNKSDKLSVGVLHASGRCMQPKQGKATTKSNVKKSSKAGNVSKKVNAGEVLHGSGSWVDPRSCAGITKDSDRRPVHASGQSVGHWYTSPEGKKVYVSKSGQELTGQIAYRHYKKENGARFKKAKTKTNSKKKKG